SARELVDARYCALGVLDPTKTYLSEFITVGLTDDQRAAIGELPKGHGILGLLILEPTSIRLPDLTKHPDSFGFPPHHPPMRSFLGVPIFGNRGVLGNLYLAEKTDGETFTDEDEDIAILLAANTAAAVENARHHEESARLLAEVQTSLADRALRRVTPAAELKHVTLQLVSAPNLPPCATDASRVEQILINLLANAIRYAPEGSIVRVSVSAGDRRIVYRVEDE